MNKDFKRGLLASIGLTAVFWVHSIALLTPAMNHSVYLSVALAAMAVAGEIIVLCGSRWDIYLSAIGWWILPAVPCVLLCGYKYFQKKGGRSRCVAE